MAVGDTITVDYGGPNYEDGLGPLSSTSSPTTGTPYPANVLYGTELQETDTIKTVGTSGSGGTGITLNNPLVNAHATSASVIDYGTGITVTQPFTSAHDVSAAVQGLGSGVTLSAALAGAHNFGASVFATTGTGITVSPALTGAHPAGSAVAGPAFGSGLTGAPTAYTMIQGDQGGESPSDVVRGADNNGGLYGENAGWTLSGYPDSNWTPLTSSLDKMTTLGTGATVWNPAPFSDSTPGIAWYRDTFSLNLPSGIDPSLALNISDIPTKVYRAIVFVNGWNLGQYINNFGPQTSYVIPTGILNPNGSNTVAIAVLTPGNATGATGGGLGVVTLSGVPNQYTYDDTSPAITYTGTGWSSVNATTQNYVGGDFDQTESFSSTAGDSVTLNFTGTAIRWIASQASNHGIANVILDGTQVATVDQYGSRTVNQVTMWAAYGLTNGPHTLTLVNTGNENAAASGTFLDVDAFDVPPSGIVEGGTGTVPGGPTSALVNSPSYVAPKLAGRTLGSGATGGATVDGTVATVLEPNQPEPVSTGSEPNDSLGTALAANIDWGDGNQTAGTVSGSNGSYTVNGQHTYATPGSHNVSITLTDQYDNSTLGTATATAVAAPVTTAALSPAPVNGEYQNPTTVTLSTRDGSGPGVAATYYQVDAGAYQTYSAPFAVSGTGNHTVNYYSVDTQGNTEQTETATFLITPPPTTTASVSPAAVNGYYNINPTVTLTANDGSGPGVQTTFYQIDNGGYQTYTTPFTVTGDGPHAIQFYSVDTHGTAETPNTLNIKIDTTAPTTTASPSPAAVNGYYNQNPTITLNVSDAVSGVASTSYSIDSGAFQAYAGAFTLSGDGTHTVRFFSTDNAGNVEATKSMTFVIDTAAPTTTAALTPAPVNGFYASDPTVTLSASDSLSGVSSTSYQIDGGSVHTYSGPFVIIGDGSHTLQYWSTDVAGNVEGTHTVTVIVDTTPPSTTATVSPVPNAGATNGPATITLHATDAVSGVAGTFYTVDGGAAQGYTGVPFTINAGGAHTVLYYSTDNAGNIEAVHTLAIQVNPQATTTVIGTVASTLTLAVASTPPTLGQFLPGVANTYTASLGATITTTGQTSTLSASDPSTLFPGHLVNSTAVGGPYALAQGLQVDAADTSGVTSGGGTYSDLSTANPATLLTFAQPVTNDPVTLGFKQPIAATDPLRTGAYNKTIVFTVSTNTP